MIVTIRYCVEVSTPDGWRIAKIESPYTGKIWPLYNVSWRKALRYARELKIDYPEREFRATPADFRFQPNEQS